MSKLQSILYAENDPNEVFLLTRGLKRLGFQNPIHHVDDGEGVIQYLSGATPYADRKKYPLPAIMLLDLKMPRKDGFDVLRWARSDERFKNLPIIVLTTSKLERDRKLASQLGATAFITKSLDWTEVFRTLHEVLRDAETCARKTGAEVGRHAKE